MITIATVLRSGGPVYDERWVHALRAGVAEYLKAPHRFVCLSDVEVPGVETAPLAHDFPGWWAKIELFRPGVFEGPTLYMDLDTLPVGWLLDLTTYDGPLAMLSDFNRPRLAQSGVMAFRPGPVTEALWEDWIKRPGDHMSAYRGDGEWLHDHTNPDRLQDLFPGQIVSFKLHARGDAPGGARLVCGHGRPRFTEQKAGWAHAMWSERAA